MTLAVQCNNVWKRYSGQARGIKEFLVGRNRSADCKYSREWALQDINFSVSMGTAFGIVGHNGTGKSTLLSLLLHTIKPDKGDILVNGRVASLLELDAGFHPELTGYENIFLYGSILGMSKKEILKQYKSIVEFSELGVAINNPVRTYSDGMKTRLGFSIIINTPADILLIDEILAAGDSHFQDKCKYYLKQFRDNNGTLIIVSHDMGFLNEMCQSGMRLEMGKVVEINEISEIIEHHETSMHYST